MIPSCDLIGQIGPVTALLRSAKHATIDCSTLFLRMQGKQPPMSKKLLLFLSGCRLRPRQNQ